MILGEQPPGPEQPAAATGASPEPREARLREAHEIVETPLVTSTFVLSLRAFLLLEMSL